MKEVFVLRYKCVNEIEAFESHDDAVNAGVEFTAEMGAENGLSEMEINDEVSEFIQFKNNEVVELYICNVKEARQ